MDNAQVPQQASPPNATSPAPSTSPMPPQPKRSNKKSIILPVIIVVVILAGIIFLLSFNQTPSTTQSALPENVAPTNVMEADPETTTSFKKISEPELLFTGGYADPTVVKKADNSLIMYLNNFTVQPATYQAYTSEDGKTWKLATAKLPRASTGRAVKFGTTIRLYYPDQTPIRPTDPPAAILSAISPDGFTFTNESGTRVSPQEGYYLEGPTVFQVEDTYRMFFSENETASAEKRISKIWGAASKDGKTWERDREPSIEATEQDEHIPPDWPQALHPFVLTRPDGTYLMFYNTHSEVFAATSEDGTTWKKLGSVGIHGADVDGYYLPDGSIRLYYGDFSEQTSGVVYTIDIKET